ncbi:hypothetical protein B0T26DRAFT_757960 [Lasiosphaeria miniovina]|uniref:Uncharacterized protein n=1 Tax=Lasiosphaeria miniovina TaxID=1954250 RepID=A0AA39ZQT4_9PEZI|nr:uncharacterized protein B0T26DRAFT_757960 [Lasiosphaeria miniovina]KAK0701995.1 hypothetical protein B0T26DRAFT_757960 [Lasiosphaeria miniovina]
MLASLGPGLATLSPIIVGLQALALAALVLWLVLYHGSQVADAPKAKKGANKSRAHIGNETSIADEFLSFDEDPFSLVHFHVCLPSGHTRSKKLKPSSRPPRTQPVELVFHSSWLFTPEALSLHISRDGVSAFRGSYLNQFLPDGEGNPRYFAVHDGGAIRLPPNPITGRDTNNRQSGESWHRLLTVIAVVASLTSIALGIAERFASGSNSNDGLSQFLWRQAVETQPLELWD